MAYVCEALILVTDLCLYLLVFSGIYPAVALLFHLVECL